MNDYFHDLIEAGMKPARMNTVTAERKFHAAIFQRTMEKWEIERDIVSLERKFRKAEKIGNVSGTFEIQDELGVMYKRLMKIWSIKSNKR